MAVTTTAGMRKTTNETAVNAQRKAVLWPLCLRKKFHVAWKTADVSTRTNAQVVIAGHRKQPHRAASEVVHADPAVHDKRGAGCPGRLVGGEVERRVDDVLRAAEAAERDAAEPLEAFLFVGEQRLQHGRQDGPGTDGVGPNVVRAELHGERAREREHGALARRVRVLGYRAPQQRDERGDVDDRAAAGLDQLRHAVLAAEEDALQV